ncbi:hypothetical protein CAC42_4207 [Sphaceloma murrayae]|uniref:Ankyrin repeat protein n=1 Tax=Sphaceloma murrayae TaxID=2082308 RepID=A0A2K1QKT0_9PEZI|nr:hypothetical protein CAC42_4207 [Sphaceloma murrayae]
MAALSQPITLPALPAEHKDFIKYAIDNEASSMADLLQPYKAYDNVMREVFAQQPDHEAISTPNIVSLYRQRLKIKARDLAAESDEERSRYLIPLQDTERRAGGSPAFVKTLQDFRKNFSIFSESSLSELDWSNVVCAGSAVATCLLPAPEKYAGSKRSMRQYYHEKIAPASDVDLFLYGLTEEQAVEKIKQIEKCVRDSILTEITTIRTKNAITIASQHPTRHIQIVLRLYKSVSEILTGFDVDSSCTAYDGKEVYASPRAIGAFMTQVNTIDLSRRSPSYENRLSKYSKRGFEVYWPNLQRDRVDPTIFERNFTRTNGLARLLVLEKLPSKGDRESYQDQRRRERGRPTLIRSWNGNFRGNVKDQHEDEIPEWLDEEPESNYHTFTVPYGPKYHAKKIEKMLYAKDMLLNAEWNRPKDRDTNLHRHPAFFGNVEDVITDCCGYCPNPLTPEDEEIQEEEGKIYVSGKVSFLQDDPGRQAIGSFNPITDQDWTEMAYIGNTEQLCQAIVDHDLGHVQEWLKLEDADPNRRDHTGRTPLQLAVQSSSNEVVQALIDGGARLIARMADGRTALHLSAMLGKTDMVGMILRKSEQNEEEEEAKKDALKATSTAGPTPSAEQDVLSKTGVEDDDGFEQDDEEEEENEDEDAGTTTDGSYVRIRSKDSDADQSNVPDDDNEDEPDIVDVNVTAWDVPVTPLHLAIANGHSDTVKLLVQEHGADVLLPVKLLNSYDKSPRGAILPLVIAMLHTKEKAEELVELLIRLGASAAQADMDQFTPVHVAAAFNASMLKTLLDIDSAGSKRVLRHLAVRGSSWSPSVQGPLQSAIKHGQSESAQILLNAGVEATVDSDSYVESIKSKAWANTGNQENDFKKRITQPVMMAVENEMPSLAVRLLEAGADPNTLSTGAWERILDNSMYTYPVASLLDQVDRELDDLRRYSVEGEPSVASKPIPLKKDSSYLKDYRPGSYLHWRTLVQIKEQKEQYNSKLKTYNQQTKAATERKGIEEKRKAVTDLIDGFETLRKKIVALGGKSITVLHPGVEVKFRVNRGYYYRHPPEKHVKLDKSYSITGLTEKRREGYDRLFQAAWDNDIETIRKLTLAIWDENNSPLQIAIKDGLGLSPFSIAVCRGHRALAETIMEIAQAQYSPEDDSGNKTRFDLEAPEAEDDSCYDSDEGDRDPDEVRIYSRLVNDTFTIDDIGAVQAQVKSKVKPLDMLDWRFPASELRHLSREPLEELSMIDTVRGALSMLGLGEEEDLAKQKAAEKKKFPDGKAGELLSLPVVDDDADMLEWVLDLGEKYTKIMANSQGDLSQLFVLPEHVFIHAMKLSRVTLLKKMIQRTGAGIPLDALVETSGVEIKSETASKYYQGLSVHGQKRADWVAQAGGASKVKGSGDSRPPLLEACRAGSLEAVEYFLSDAATRHYRDFAAKNSSDERLQTLAEAKGGLNAALDNWLGTRSHLAIHCVILGGTSPESLRLLSYLIEKMPENLDAKSDDGQTPLYLAFSLHRKSMIEVLIKAKADQTTRDSKGRNIIHAAVELYNGKENKHSGQLKSILSLIDPRLLPSLSIDRSSCEPGSLTPLATALQAFTASNGFYSPSYIPLSGGLEVQRPMIAYLATILSFTNGIEIFVVNGAGDTPVHTAMRGDLEHVVAWLVDRYPNLLWREDVTGRTPYEMAQDEQLSDYFADSPSENIRGSGYSWHSYNSGSGAAQNGPETFIKNKEEPNAKKRMWDAVKGRRVEKRRLCGLGEANEVAKRLAGKRHVDVIVVAEKGDEVRAWFESAKVMDKDDEDEEV